MTNNEKRRVIAGWCEPEPQYKPKDDPELSMGGHWDAGYDGVWEPRYDYNSLDACAEFERVVKERGLESEYEHALIRACEKPVGIRSYAASTFATATATPAQRLEAILRVIEETRAALDKAERKL